ncbi:tyrosine recombinase XerC [Streptosporangium roseum]
MFTERRLPRPRMDDPLLGSLGDLDEWLDRRDVLDGQPFLLSPQGEYDVALNRYFEQIGMATAPWNTQAAHARDLRNFLDFLWANRGGRPWREATPEDRAAYERWRRKDPAGPRVEPTTWDREVATVNAFFAWVVRQGYIEVSPIVQRESRDRRSRPGRRSTQTTPAEASHTGARRHVEWLTPGMYRRWRDIGIRGHTPDGALDPSFRGRFASRNAAFTDLMIRTGLRISEQIGLSLYELPRTQAGILNSRTWLPAPIAKWGSARYVYIPTGVLRDIWDYVEIERADAVERARDLGLYERIVEPLLIEDPSQPVVRIGGRRLPLTKLRQAERARVLVRTDHGWEPAALWLNESGLPGSAAGYRELFKDANRRCRRHGLTVSTHPHGLRHSFAVIELEHLWRGHLEQLQETNPQARMTYQRVYGDPLLWVSCRLGHRSIETSAIYLHTLQELEMETRMALIPDWWERTGVDPAQLDDPPTDGAEEHA